MRKSEQGFTLIELIVSLAILGVLVTFLILSINPGSQFSKIYDGQRKKDLAQIKVALDMYYNDHNVYPDSVPFGEEWAEGETVYMKKVPTDPDPYLRPVDQLWYDYNYLSGDNWNVLYAKVLDDEYRQGLEKSCRNLIRSLCPNKAVSSIYNYCIVSGTLNCDELTIPVGYESIPGTEGDGDDGGDDGDDGDDGGDDGDDGGNPEIPQVYACRPGDAGLTCQNIQTPAEGETTYNEPTCSNVCPGEGN
jgi:prepilin-type N-terminal cleavage/methylation domain-containing protein